MHLVGYAKDDLLRPLLLEHGPELRVALANEAAVAWCEEVNAPRHSETCAVPTERLATERDLLTALPSLQLRIGPAPVTRKVDRLATIRFGSARYSVPMRLTGASLEVVVNRDRLLLLDPNTGEVVADHLVVAPGEASVSDGHYGGPRPTPRRSLRPRSVAERQFCALGPAAVAFVTGAVAAGHTRLGPELAELNTMAAAHGEAVFVAALERATVFGRWRASDVRSILAAGAGTAHPRPAGDALVIDLPVSPGRLLSEYTPEPSSTATLMDRTEVSR